MVLQLGARVALTTGLTGSIAFVGQTSFATGKWIGVELDEYGGKNDGSVGGKRYFRTEEGRGVFVRPSGVRVLEGEGDEEVRASSTLPGTVEELTNDRDDSHHHHRLQLKHQHTPLDLHQPFPDLHPLTPALPQQQCHAPTPPPSLNLGKAPDPAQYCPVARA